MRALVTAIGLGANRPQDAVYPTSQKDARRPRLQRGEQVRHALSRRASCRRCRASGRSRCTTPTISSSHNPLNRYSISARQNLKTNADGSVDLYIQNQSPGADKESNWLPAPAGKFILMLRMYWPDEKPPSIIDGTWKPPAVKKVS